MQLDRALELTLLPRSPRARTDAPMWMRAEFDYTGKLLEGRLALELRSGREVLARYETGPIVLTEGKRAFRLILPVHGATEGPGFPVQVRARFVSAEGAFDLEPYSPPPLREVGRAMLTCFCAPRVGGDARHSRLASSLRLERLADPVQPGSSAGGAEARSFPGGARPLATGVVRMEPAELPMNAMAYCAFDTVVLAGEGFSALRQRQLDALRRWVEAGGSLLVLPQGDIAPSHVRFLEQLTAGGGAAAGATGFLGEAAAPEARFSQVALYHSGLGRTVVALTAPASEDALSREPWPEVAAFLLKVRRLRRAPPGSPGATGLPGPRARASAFLGEGGQGPFWPMAANDAGQLGALLQSEKVRILPFGAVVLILFAFLIIIGPVDYFVLGMLKARKFTWIVFPAVSVEFAVGTMLLAEAFMGSSDHTTSWTFIDVGPRRGGATAGATGAYRVLRTDRYELIFAGRRWTVRTDVKNGLSTDLSHLPAAAGRRGGWQVRPGSWSPPTYRGWVPAGYRVTQSVEQWTTTIRRTLSFQGGADDSGLDWDAVTAADLGSESWDKVARRLTAEGQFDGEIFLHHGSTRQIATVNSIERFVMTGSRRSSPQWAFLSEACSRPSEGIFQLVSQLSPSGSAFLEDAAVLDPNDPEQWLVVALKRNGADYIAYRRIYRAGTPGAGAPRGGQ